MAIYHMSAQVIGRSAGRSATAAAAYRAGEKIVDERTGEIHDYTRKKGIDYQEIMVPIQAGEWAHDRAELWNKIEQIERRKDAQLAREINIAIPRELTQEQGRNLVRDYVQKNFVDRGMIADICIHHEGGENPHAHIMLSMREVSPEGFGQKVREWNGKEQLEKWRENWACSCNKAMEKAGVNFTIDHRTLEAQGIRRAPTKHLGPSATAIERRGEASIKGNYNRNIEEIESLRKHLEQVNNELASAMRESEAQKNNISNVIKPTEKNGQITHTISNVINRYQNSERQEPKSLNFPSKEMILDAIQNKPSQEARNILNQLRQKAQYKDPKIEAQNKPECLAIKHSIEKAESAYQAACKNEQYIKSEVEKLGLFAKLQYRAGKHDFNKKELDAATEKQNAFNELSKSRHAFDEYLSRETGPAGETFRECKQHNDHIAPKAREALPFAEKIYMERTRSELNKQRERVKAKSRERGR